MAIDALGTQCNPSYTLQTGTQREAAVVGLMLALGFAVSVPDFEGPEMHYGAGGIAAHAVLDGLRATRGFSDSGLGPGNPIGLVGYSGGGQATAWATEQQPSYAPELEITASAPGGVPADLEGLARANDGGPFFGLILGAAIGVERAYPEMDLDSIFNAAGAAAKQELGDQCVDEFATSRPLQHFSDYTLPEYPDPISLPQVADVLGDNSLPKAMPQVPIYLWHSIADEIIPVAGPDELAARYCSDGVAVTYQREAGGEHITEAVAGAPGAAAYLLARFLGQSLPNTCGLNTASDTGIDSGPSGEAGSAAFTYSQVPDRPLKSFQCSLDSAEFADCPPGGISYDDLAEGEHTFQVRAVTGPTPAAPSGEPDRTPAELTFTVGPAGGGGGGPAEGGSGVAAGGGDPSSGASGAANDGKKKKCKRKRGKPRKRCTSKRR